MKNIIFDLGAVIIDIDYNATAQAFKNLGIENFDDLYSKKKQDHFFDDFETGQLSNNHFRDEIRRHFNKPVSDAQIDHAWNAMLINIPVKRMQWLSTLRPEFRVYLLSNTNKIHVEAFTEIFNATHGQGVFENCFDKIYLSCQVGLRKPHAEIFDMVVKENQLDIKETIFIDDSPQHIEGALKYGLPAYHLRDNEKVEEVFLRIIQTPNQ